MNHTFTIEMTKDQRGELVNALQTQDLLEVGSGAMKGRLKQTDGVVLSYVAVAAGVVVTVEKKPFYAPASVVESRVREKLQRAVASAVS